MSELYPCGDGIFFEEGGWLFNEQVTQSFPDHARKSIPGYKDVHSIVANLVRVYSQDKQFYRILDLGCSVGELESELSSKLPDSNISITAIDKSSSMVQRCQRDIFDPRTRFVCVDLMDFLESCVAKHESFDMVISLYTLQFLKPDLQYEALSLINKILPSEGILILADKFQNPDPEIDMVKEMELMKFKYSQGLSAEEVAGKRHALMGVQNRIKFPKADISLDFPRMEILDVSLNFVCSAFFRR